jgi:hypothetical protein
MAEFSGKPLDVLQLEYNLKTVVEIEFEARRVVFLSQTSGDTADATLFIKRNTHDY